MRARINVTGEIRPEVGERICEEFLMAERDEEIDTIVFFISSCGGNTSVISTLFELVKMSKKQVCSIGTNFVGSTAAAIFMMPQRRILLPNTNFLLHQSSKRMSESMRSNGFSDTRLVRITFKNLPEPLASHSFSIDVDKKCLLQR